MNECDLCGIAMLDAFPKHGGGPLTDKLVCASCLHHKVYPARWKQEEHAKLKPQPK